MKQILYIPFLCTLLVSCNNQQPAIHSDSVIGDGQMPNVVKDNSDNVHLVYGSGDSIMYSSSNNGGGKFLTPTLVSVLPKLAASHTRGPQVAATSNGLVLTACNDMGDIFSFVKDGTGSWKQTGKVNDQDTVAKENLMALSADGNNAFAVWLDLRDKHNKIYGAKSNDGGKTWSKNILVYASPDTTVCECCKPSVVVKGDKVYVMFRNWLNGNRDLHLIQSSNGGQTFGQAQKLGTGSWALKGCPMDGGGLVVDKAGNPQTVWNRRGKIYASELGKEEKELGEGRSCTIESVNGKNVYAWVENGNVTIMKPQGMKKDLGKGQLPILKAVNNEHVLCVWEKDKQIHTTVLEL
ncbi:MAG: exo-alpha-sialidase [Chitinophagaceae bacterium]|nr:MAG: exo-alpha-sialidase [Chitinophagaceae bacterium]